MSVKALLSAMALAAAVFSSGGCGAQFEAPPIEVTHRPSLVGAGKILRLENRSETALREVAVEIRTPTHKVTHEEAEIGGNEVLEVGWKKLGGFEIPDDAEIEIRAKGYLLPLRVELSAANKSQEGESG